MSAGESRREHLYKFLEPHLQNNAKTTFQPSNALGYYARCKNQKPHVETSSATYHSTVPASTVASISQQKVAKQGPTSSVKPLPRTDPVTTLIHALCDPRASKFGIPIHPRLLFTYLARPLSPRYTHGLRPEVSPQKLPVEPLPTSRVRHARAGEGKSLRYCS